MDLDANTPMSATLTAQEWNIVLAGLQELPYRVAAQVIPKLAMQLQQTPPETAKPNGEIVDHAADR